MDAGDVTDAQIIELDISDIPMDQLASIESEWILTELKGLMT